MPFPHLYLYFLQHECKLWAKAQQVQTISQNDAIYQIYESTKLLNSMHKSFYISVLTFVLRLFLISVFISLGLVFIPLGVQPQRVLEGATQVLHESMIRCILQFGPLMWTSPLSYKRTEEFRNFHPPRMHNGTTLKFLISYLTFMYDSQVSLLGFSIINPVYI